MTINSIRRSLKQYENGYWGERISAQLVYLHEFSEHFDESISQLLQPVAEKLLKDAESVGFIDEKAGVSFEQALETVSVKIKNLTVHAVGHAHIDMNWMWRYDETVDITLETFRTVLMLMREFPEFTFSQSQASCYRIVEKYDKTLLNEIRKKVAEGRWEVAASTWTETDKNLPNGESLARHILYTKQYLNKMFDIPQDELKLDFEPDTFGHNLNVPEILSEGGVEYYYHCRGNTEFGNLYNWRSPSGAQVLVYREPDWYNCELKAENFVCTPSVCKRNGVRDMLRVYGIGDHGGGPTRRDLERLTDMMTWPLFPTIIFSSYHKFFDIVKDLRESFPVVNKELNFIFTGCYTTQTRIKAANRLAEAALFEAEALTALSPVKTNVDTALFEEAWRDVLFNHFHDIIPGSGVIDTREHALGLFQNVLANANSQKGIACYAIADSIDTSTVAGGRSDKATVSEGAGAGYAVETKHGLSHVERGKGTRRGYLLFNTAGEREDLAELTLWDWPGDFKAMIITDTEGNTVPYQILNENENFWGHYKTDIVVQTSLPAMGWRLIVIDEDRDSSLLLPEPQDPRVHTPFEYILENEIIRAEIDPVSGQIGKIINKKTGSVTAQYGGFNGFTESSGSWGTAWMVLRYKNDETPVIVDSIEYVCTGDLRKTVKINGRYKNSKISYDISLDSGSEYLTIKAQVDWLEPGSPETGTPHFRFTINNTFDSDEFLYDIPFGSIKRRSADSDYPGLSYVCSLPDERKNALAIISREKYASRCYNGVMALTLIRSSYDPDPYPELCRHNFTFYIVVPECNSPDHLNELSKKLCHPTFPHSVTAHTGILPAVHSLMACDAIISGIKPAEDGSEDIIIRLYNVGDRDRIYTVSLSEHIESAYLCSITEVPGEKLLISSKEISVPIGKYKLATIRVKRS